MITGVYCLFIWFSLSSNKVQCCLDFVYNNLEPFDFKHFFFNFCFRNKTQSSTADPKLIQSECREGTRTWFGFALIMLQFSLLTRIVHSECVWITKYLIKYKKLIKRYSQNSMCTVYQTMLFLLLFRLNGLIKTCPFNNYNLWLHCCIISAKQNYNLKSWSKWHEWVIKLKYSCVKNVLLNIDI